MVVINLFYVDDLPTGVTGKTFQQKTQNHNIMLEGKMQLQFHAKVCVQV